jgi:hypothetical protein
MNTHLTCMAARAAAVPLKAAFSLRRARSAGRGLHLRKVRHAGLKSLQDDQRANRLFSSKVRKVI